MPWERKGLDFEAAIVDVLLPHIRATYAGDGDRESDRHRWAVTWRRMGSAHRPAAPGRLRRHRPTQSGRLPTGYVLRAGVGRSGPPGFGVPRLWIDVAERDTSRVGAEELANLLDDLGLTYAWSSAPGTHGRLLVVSNEGLPSLVWPGRDGRWRKASP